MTLTEDGRGAAGLTRACRNPETRRGEIRTEGQQRDGWREGWRDERQRERERKYRENESR